MGDPASTRLPEQLATLGFELGRLKTGTTPRLNGKTIDYEGLVAQPGDENPKPFSFTTTRIPLAQVPCHITYTNAKTHDIIREGLDRSPLFSGIIEGTGARYCPSIEDKVVRFAEKERHQVFLNRKGSIPLKSIPTDFPPACPLTFRSGW